MSSAKRVVINSPSSKGKDVSEDFITNVEQMNRDVADLSLDTEQDDADWELIQRKPKNRAGASAARPLGPQTSNVKPWGGMWGNAGAGRASENTRAAQNTDSRMVTGKGITRPQTFNRGFEAKHWAPHLSAPLEHGWNWPSRAGFNPAKGPEDGHGKNSVSTEIEKDSIENDVDESDDEAIDDSDDELLSDYCDSDTSQKSHETRKKNRWFQKFFDSLDRMSIEVISDPERQWHCPACQGGPGAIDWYRGLQPLMTHAKTKGSKRVKLHRELAELLDEELRLRGTTVVPAGEAYGKWKGLKDEEKDYEIVWPPMVVILNTRLEQDDNDKWIGMGNQELLDYFSSYAAVRARHSYGPQGHRGMSLLIFESTARGYLEAEHLHKHFVQQGTDRDAWGRRQILFHPGGTRQLYGFMAIKEDLDSFNRHCQGKSRVKFEMRSYQEMVVKQIRKMSEENQQLIFYKKKVATEQKLKSALEESFGIVSEKLRKTVEENRIVRQRTKMQHEQNKEEMDYQEQFFKEQIQYIHDARNEKEENFEKLQQIERERVKQACPNPSKTDEFRRRADEFCKLQDEEMEIFVSERDKLIKEHEKKMACMRQRHRNEEVKLEEEFDTELGCLMEKYAPDSSKVSTLNA